MKSLKDFIQIRIMNQKIGRLLPLSGVCAPVIYACVVLVTGFLRPGYSHVAQSLSELGEAGAPYALVMNGAGFMILGVLLILFACALHRGIPDGSRAGPAFVVLSGFSLVLVSLFPCDPGCVDITVTGEIHSITATVSAVTMICAILFTSPRLYTKDKWKKYGKFSLATGVLTGIISLCMFSPGFENYAGLIQRVSMGLGLLWVEVIGMKLSQIR